MIPRMTSHELNKTLDNANDKLNNIFNDIKGIKTDLITKLKITRYENEYISSIINEFKLGNKLNSESLTLFDNNLSKEYLRYGCTVMPKLKGNPINVFNVLTTDTGEAFFRDIANVEINGHEKEEYKDILKHDTIEGQSVYFEEVKGNNPKITIKIKLDKTKSIGYSLFNMIELDTFFNGSFDIENIRIENENEEIAEYSSYTNAGKMRILLDKLYTFNIVTITIVPKYSVALDNNTIYPVGIKHIYFYNIKMVENSYAIAIIESDNFINMISDTIFIRTPNKLIESSIKNEGIELFLGYETTSDGTIIFNHPIEASTTQVIRPISMNAKRIYAKVPIKNTIIGINFDISNKEEYDHG